MQTLYSFSLVLRESRDFQMQLSDFCIALRVRPLRGECRSYWKLRNVLTHQGKQIRQQLQPGAHARPMSNLELLNFAGWQTTGQMMIFTAQGHPPSFWIKGRYWQCLLSSFVWYFTSWLTKNYVLNDNPPHSFHTICCLLVLTSLHYCGFSIFFYFSAFYCCMCKILSVCFNYFGNHNASFMLSVGC